MIDAGFRSLITRISQPLVSLLIKWKVSPNALTLLGFTIALLAGISTASRFYLAGILLWWLSRIFDGLDGVLARASGRASEFGGFLDIVFDMAAYGIMILGFSYSYPLFYPYFIVIMFLYILCITTALALGAAERKKVKKDLSDNRSFRLASGLAEGGETGLFYTAFALMPQYLAYLLPLWIFILGVTVVSRIIVAKSALV